MQPIDLRSDTITQPCPAMRQAMANAEVGDDVLGADPTVKKLEEYTAQLLGKEAAIFVPSGTMSNQIAVRCLTEPGDEIIMEQNSHCYYYEAGAPAALSGVSCRLIPGTNGIFSAADVNAALRPSNIHFSPTKAILLENTHNRGGGAVWPIESIKEISEFAATHSLKMHLDGARLWNASAATGIPESDYAQYFDTINVCYSKGLGAPVGSALAGPKDIIERAIRFRKQFGGGMRQSGIIAAGALYALQNNRARLAQDHTNARTLAEGISHIDGIEIDLDKVQTNIVVARITAMPAETLVKRLNDKGVWILPISPTDIRTVTNLMVSADDIQSAINAFAQTISEQ